MADGALAREIPEAHSDSIFGVDFGRTANPRSCGADKFVKVFDLSTGKLAKSFEGTRTTCCPWPGKPRDAR